MELFILLLIAAAVTTALGLLIAGFIYVPWLIVLVLMGLFLALTRVSLPKTDSIATSNSTAIDPTATNAGSEAQDLMEWFDSRQVSQTATNPVTDATQVEHHEPVLSYRGARYSV